LFSSRTIRLSACALLGDPNYALPPANAGHETDSFADTNSWFDRVYSVQLSTDESGSPALNPLAASHLR
jgi:hypothetical protein